MVYLKYHEDTEIVVKISENEIANEQGYKVAKSYQFVEGDEFDKTIYVNEVDEIGEIATYTAVRNTERMKDILVENVNLKNRIKTTELALLDLIIAGGRF